MLSILWVVCMGAGAVASLTTFFDSDPQSAPQQAVVGVWALYYLILPYTCCRAVEAAIRNAKSAQKRAKQVDQTSGSRKNTTLGLR